MSDSAAIREVGPLALLESIPHRSNFGRWCRLAFVVLFAVGPFLFNSIRVHQTGLTIFGDRAEAGWTFAILEEIASLFLVAYILMRCKVRWRELGIRWSLRGILVGLALAAVSYAAYWAAYHSFVAMHNAFWPTVPFQPEPSSIIGRPAPLLTLLMCINPFFEELIVRAFLMSEVKALTGSWIPAVLLSTLIQASYHIYYGWIVTIALAFQFLVFSIFYARRRQAVPLIVAHGYFDLYWVVLGLL